MSLITFIQAIATMITGPFGIGAITVAIAGTFIAAAIHMVPVSWGWRTLACGGCAFSAAWAVTTFMHA